MSQAGQAWTKAVNERKVASCPPHPFFWPYGTPWGSWLPLPGFSTESEQNPRGSLLGCQKTLQNRVTAPPPPQTTPPDHVTARGHVLNVLNLIFRAHGSKEPCHTDLPSAPTPPKKNHQPKPNTITPWASHEQHILSKIIII